MAAEYLNTAIEGWDMCPENQILQVQQHPTNSVIF